MFLQFEQLQQRGIPHSERQLRRLEAEGRFPRRIHLSAQKVAWDAAEIEQWCAQRRAARDPAKCWVCAEPATRVMDGVACCANHSQLSRDPYDPPPAPCAVPGCGAESNRTIYGRPVCAMHDERDF